MAVLDQINNENDIKKIKPEDYPKLAKEIRSFLIDKISAKGGHLASNLGVVELTMALHLVLNLPKDKLIFDVGHQCYTHKILTGRKDGFDHLRTYGGLSGFPKRSESPCDSFDTGHSSTSISAALGMAQAMVLKNDPSKVVCVIGDASLTGGLALEALNNVASLKRNLVIILNDNNMSISENVGGMNTYLSNLRAGERYNDLKSNVLHTLEKVPSGETLIRNIKKAKSSLKSMMVGGMYFENLGITYLGPVDGHDIEAMVKLTKEALKLDHPCLIHVITKKGKGFIPSESHPESYHSIGAFNPENGCPIPKTGITFTKVVSASMLKLGRDHENVVAITAAMKDGTGLSAFAKEFPNRFFDVGIAEQHAVTFAAGLACQGFHPYVAIYSSFLQRAYDEILHDVCIQDLPVTFLIDRAGLVPGDGQTHQGIYDISYLSSIPNLYIFAPKNKYELYDVINYSYHFQHPLAIRYPKAIASDHLKEFRSPIELGKSELLYKERDIAILCTGSMVSLGERVRRQLKAEGYHVSLLNARFVKPLDEELLNKLSRTHSLIVTIEDNVLNGSYGMAVATYYSFHMGLGDNRVKVLPITIPNTYVEQGTMDELFKITGLNEEEILTKIKAVFE